MRTRSIVLTLALAGVSLAACNKQTDQTPAAPATGAPIASLPLAQGEPPPLIAAPALAALPSAPPVHYASAPPRERYRYIDRARALGAAFADSPPDYTVDYAGVRPWIWRSGRGEYRVVEPTPDGDRTYYYDAGSDEPFLISDPQYAYGFSRGELTVVYAPDGRVVDYDPSSADRAARELARARALYAAAVHQQRQAAYAAAWLQRREQVLAEQRAWDAEQERDAEWRQWHEDHQRAEQADWDRERAMRAAYAATVAATIVSAVASGHDHDQDRRPSNILPPPPEGQPPFAQPGQPGAPGPNPSFPGRRDDHGQAQAQAQQQAQVEASRREAEAARSAQAAAQADAARKTQLQAAQIAAARQQAQAAQAAQADAARRAQLAAAGQAAARQQAEAARAAQADAARKAQLQAAGQAAARQQAEAARSAQGTAQAEAARKAQAQAAEQAAARQQGEAARQAQLEAVRKAQAQDAQAAAGRQQADAARAAEQAQRAQAQAQAARQRQVQAAQQAQAAAKAQAQAQNPEAVKRGDQIKADMARLAAKKGDKPGDRKDHQNQQ